MRRQPSYSLYRRGKVWWFKCYPEPGSDPVRGSLRTNSKTEAERIAPAADAAEIAKRQALVAGQPKVLTLGTALLSYFEDRGRHTKTGDDIERYSKVLAAELGDTPPVMALSQRRLQDYIVRR